MEDRAVYVRILSGTIDKRGVRGIDTTILEDETTWTSVFRGLGGTAEIRRRGFDDMR